MTRPDITRLVVAVVVVFMLVRELDYWMKCQSDWLLGTQWAEREGISCLNPSS